MGWGDAWAGLSQQAFGATVDILQQKEQRKYQTERDEMARRAAEQQEEARRKWEEKTLRLRASLDKEARREEQSFRSKESDKGRKFEAQQAAEQRGLTRSYYDQMDRNEQARLGLQREEMAQRREMAGAGLSGRGGGGGQSSPKVPDSILKEASDKIIERSEALQADQSLSREDALGQAYAEVQQEYGPEVARQIRPGLDNIQGQLLRGLGKAARYFQQ